MLRPWVFPNFVLLSRLHHAVCLDPEGRATPGYGVQILNVMELHRSTSGLGRIAGGAFEIPHAVPGGVAKIHDRRRIL